MNITSSNVHPSCSPTPKRRKSCLNFFRSEEWQVSPADARNILLVVAALIATVTFQIGVNPPGGVWQDTKDGHEAGTAIYAPIKNSTEHHDSIALRGYDSKAATYFLFLICNTITLSTSVVLMLSLTSKFPLRFLMFIATAGMMITYFSSIYAITPNDYTGQTAVCFVGIIPIVIWFLDVFIFDRLITGLPASPSTNTDLESSGGLRL